MTDSIYTILEPFLKTSLVYQPARDAKGRTRKNHNSLCTCIGVISTCKAVISEVSDDSNQAFGVTVLGAAVGTGYIIGPAVAGAIADPVGQYNLTITS